ncbi:hypothetical protein [Ancylobacter lacus]|uniref:hypothetical protein n=1 Tax=Ancylobacter lacus TaxID=2579970 RepID=UPI001BCE7487|nr:hypothetical protein [Ancylobacter lacus]MBS7537749.1 hypothetical protein [Ancylobacter lacus]
MLDIPFKIFPPALLAGLLLYAGITALWLQPLVERRLADRVYIPQCEAGLIKAQSRARAEQDGKRNAARQMMDMFRSSPLGQFPGFNEMMEQGRVLAEAGVPELPSAGIDHSSRCACAVSSAFDAARLPMLLHVMSLRTYQPAALTALPFTAGTFLDSSCIS